MAAELDIASLTPDEQMRLIRMVQQQESARFAFKHLRDLFCSKDGFGITTATPLQLAICDVIEGLPVSEEYNVVSSFGGVLPQLREPPKDLVIAAAARGGKSMLAAAGAIWCSQNVDLSLLADGEIPRFVVVSLSKDNARVILQHLLGALAKPALAPIHLDIKKVAKQWKGAVDDSGNDFIGSEFIRHPSGRPIEIRVVAGKRAGGSAVSRWLVGMVLDEAPRMLGQDDAVINYDDMHDAAMSRILPGGTILSIGSPWQPFGPIYDMVEKNFGKPTEDCVIIRAGGPAMNPIWWTEKRCEQLKRTNPEVYQTDVLAEFCDVSSTLFPQPVLSAATRQSPAIIEYEEGHSYAAKIDPATRRNAWTLVIADRVRRLITKDSKQRLVAVYRVVYNQQWQGSPQFPLSPRVVLTEIAEILRSYHLAWCFTDQWSADALIDIATGLGLFLHKQEWTEKEKVQAYLNLESAMKDGQVELSPDPVLLADLRLTKKIPTQHGVSIRLIETGDGRHCDYSPAITGALAQWIEEDKPVAPKAGEPGFDSFLDKQLEENEIKTYCRKADTWWQGGMQDA